MPIMHMTELKKIPNIEQDKKLLKKYAYFEKLINELKKRDLPAEIMGTINQNIEEINAISGSNEERRKRLQQSISKILKLLEKKIKLVPRNHYRDLWMVLGMSVFGMPMGVAIGAGLDNMAFLAIGIPIGMAIGMGIGAGMDKKAQEEGRQLDIEKIY
jgi:hypothetical protein